MSVKGRRQGKMEGKPETPGTPLPVEIGELLAGWRARLAAIEDAQEPAPEDLNGMKWELGRDICSVIEAAAADSPRTPLIQGIAERLECSGSLIYNLTNVARAFPDGLPRQRWDMLARLARMKPEERESLLAELPDWAPTRSLSRQGPARATTAEADADQAESDRRKALRKDADVCIAALPPDERIYLLLDLLRSARDDFAAIPKGSTQSWYLQEFEQALARLRESSLDGADAPAPREAGHYERPSPPPDST